MAIDLTKPAGSVKFTDAEYGPMLANLQANILRPHGRDYTRHVFLKFTAPAAAVRTWIRTKVASQVTSAKVQMEQIEARRQAKAANQDFDGGPVTLFFLSAAGYTHLDLDKSKFPGKAFGRGMKDRNDYVLKQKLLGLIKVKQPNMDPPKSAWEGGFQGEIHALLILGDDGDDATDARLATLLQQTRSDFAGVAQELAADEGRVLRRRLKHPTEGDYIEPIEHFGYFDGISQPLFSQEEIEDYEKKFDRPLGDGDWDPGASLDLVLRPDPFATVADAYGSFFVYRKLSQNFDQFRQRESALKAATQLPGEQAGAMAVGRFTDGTPIALHASPTSETQVDNCFDYATDPDGFKCPVHAHVRKVNPRATTRGHTLEESRARRIARRGIPYGLPVPALNLLGEPTAPPSAPRGLLFMCYQADLDEQFEFIQRVWVDNPEFPRGFLFEKKSGDDPLIGQKAGSEQRWPKKWGDEDKGRTKVSMDAAVTLKGGEYFFAPSTPFLAGL